MVFVETPTFQASIAKLFSEDDLAALQTILLLQPDVGDVIPHSGGLRKVRVPARGKGKRGGGRVIYHWAAADSQIFLLYAYAKNQRADITTKQARMLRQLID